MKPILKYRGGKWQEIPNFKKYIPRNFDRYIEPFFGGGAVYFYLESPNSIINDINTRLINFYRDVAENYEVMRQQLDELQALYEANQREYEMLKAQADKGVRVPNQNEDLYYHMRDLFNNNPNNEYLDSVIYFFINKTAYSGMIRYNRRGEYNVPFGRYKNFNTHLLTERHHELLSTSQIFNEDYSVIFDMARPDDFMFLDPPYDTIFNDYGNEHNFNEEEQRRLAMNFRNLNCKALMVIGRTELTEELYGDMIIENATYKKNYGVNIRNRFNSRAEHILVSNYNAVEVAQENICEQATRTL